MSNNYAGADFSSLRLVAVNVTPNDAADLPRVPAVITAATSGAIKITDTKGNTTTQYCNAGLPLLVIVARVWADGTTATGITALYQS